MLGKTRRPEIRAIDGRLRGAHRAVRRSASHRVARRLRRVACANWRSIPPRPSSCSMTQESLKHPRNSQNGWENRATVARAKSFSLRRRRRFSRGVAPPRHAKTFTFFVDVLARTRPRHARRATLPRFRHPRGAPVPEIIARKSPIFRDHSRNHRTIRQPSHSTRGKSRNFL